MSENQGYDVVVAGASIGGIISAAALLNAGYRVAIVDALQAPGSRWGSVPYNGYWINWGHRDGHGISDLLIASQYRKLAEAAAGIEMPVIEGGYGNLYRIHKLPEDRVIELTYEQMLGKDSGDSLDRFRFQVREFGGFTEDVDAIATAVKEGEEKLLSFSDEEAWGLVEVTLGEWLDRNVADARDEDCAGARLESTNVSPGEEASLGRYIRHIRTHLHVPGPPQDPDAGGMQSVVAAFMRRIHELGGAVMMGWKPERLVLGHNDVVEGLVVVNENSFVRVLEAPVVITDFEGWDLDKLVDRDRLPKEFVKRAEALRNYQGETISWFAGLKRMPRIRATGQVEDNPAWNRITRREGGAFRHYHGGWHFTSLHQSNAAPEGKHLLHCTLAYNKRRYADFAEAQRDIDINVDYLRKFYVDLDECLDWSEYQHVQAPQVVSWYLRPIRRHPVKVATIPGFYCASATAETPGVWASAEISSALAAVELVKLEYPLSLIRN
jgi:phytoene dehydrogenase-like protein